MPSPRVSARRQERAYWARTNQPIGNLLRNLPDGFPSSYPPGVAVPPGGQMWWIGSDQLHQALPTATALAAVGRATSLIVNTLTMLPIRILTGGPSRALSRIEVPAPRWIADPMLVRPDDRFTGSPAPAARSLTSSQFWAEFMRSAVWFGNGFMIAEEDADGGPVAGTCRILHPDMVSPQYDSDTGLVYRRIGEQSGGSYVDTDETGRCLLGGRVYRLIQLRHPHSPIDELGMAKGTLEMYRAELQLAGQAVSYGSSMYRSGIPAGYLKTTLPNFTKEQSDRLKAQWMDYHGGDERSIGVLNATTDWHSIQMSPLDMALIQMMQWNLVSISNAFGVPAFYLGHDATSSNTYSNAESRNSDLRQSLMPWAVVFEELLTAQFPANSWVEIDWRGLLRPDAAQRYSAYSTAIKDGWLTPDEVRAIESLPPLPEQGYLGVDPRLGQNTTTEEVPADGAVG